MLVGLPCSGKSTFAETTDLPIVSSDHYIELVALRENTSYNAVFKRCVDKTTKQVVSDVEALTRNNQSFIWDQTNLTTETRGEKLSRIPENYIKIAVVFEAPLEQIESRNIRTGKIIPPYVLKNMLSSFEYPTTEEGFDYVV